MFDHIRMGVLSIDAGPYAFMGELGRIGVEMALDEFGHQTAGRPIATHYEGTNAIYDTALFAAEALIEQKNCDFVIGPLSGDESYAIRDYARTRPDRTFINGASSAPDPLIRDVPPNFFSFIGTAMQWMVGLGHYAYEVLGYRRVITLAEDYSYPQGQVAGFMLEFCRAGGCVPHKYWVRLGQNDFAALIASMPTDIDAIFVCLAGADAVTFLEQYTALGRSVPLICGTTTVDQTVLNVTDALVNRLVGVIMAGPMANDNPLPAWKTFVAQSQAFGIEDYPSLLTYLYYVNTKSALLALEQIGGDLSDGQTKFRAALAHLQWESPSGELSLDADRLVIAPQFISKLSRDERGKLYSHTVSMIPRAEPLCGLTKAEYLNMGSIGRDQPNCPCG